MAFLKGRSVRGVLISVCVSACVFVRLVFLLGPVSVLRDHKNNSVSFLCRRCSVSLCTSLFLEVTSEERAER